MNKIKIRYSHNIEYPWRVFDVTNNLLHHSKTLNMHGTFIGEGSQILAYGTYTKSLTSIKIDTSGTLPMDREGESKEIEQIDEITIFSQTDDLPVDN